ncbi:MAG: hypothetical protein IJV01_00865 [Bacteroidales bacterium]|nr:hypothetical protein [Bacteroidales bacterium]
MKHTKILAALLPLMILASCAKQNSAEVKLIPMTFGVKMDMPVAPETDANAPELRTTLSGTSVKWQAGDKIAIIPKGTTKVYEFTLVSGAGTTSATFSGTCPEGADDTYYAFYPYEDARYYSVAGKSPRSGTQTGFQRRIPATQTAVEGDLPAKLGFAIGESVGGADLVMKNCLSVFKFQVEDSDVESVSIVGTNGTVSPIFAGNFAVQYPLTDEPSGFTTSAGVGGSGRTQGITVLPPSGEDTFSTGKTYYAVACPINSTGTLSTGAGAANNYPISISLRKEGYYYEKTTASAVSLSRNTIYDLGTLSRHGTAWTAMAKDVWTADFSTANFYTQPGVGDANVEAWPTSESNGTSKAAYYPFDAAGNRAKVQVSQSSSKYCWDSANTSLYLNTAGGTRVGVAISPSLYRAITKIKVTLVRVEGDSDSPKIYLTESAGSGTSPWGSETVDMSALAAGATKEVSFDVSEPATGTFVCVNFYNKIHVRSIQVTYDGILPE